jgi:hypothetical protein
MTKLVPVRIAELHPKRLLAGLLHTKAKPLSALTNKPLTVFGTPKGEDIFRRLRQAGL